MLKICSRIKKASSDLNVKNMYINILSPVKIMQFGNNNTSRNVEKSQIVLLLGLVLKERNNRLALTQEVGILSIFVLSQYSFQQFHYTLVRFYCVISSE